MKQRLSVPDGHPFFVGRNDPRRSAAGDRDDARSGLKICHFIHLDTQPRSLAAHPLANRCAVFADAAGEDKVKFRAEKAGGGIVVTEIQVVK